ncbi:MAG: hypothetical protein H0X24_02355 [Ktedonobacterales bacterium]|nr:hypothetical protein [Ktedonobacterales bacterium]
MDITLNYPRPTTVAAGTEATSLELAANDGRGVVAFRGRAQHPLVLRQLLLALHATIPAASQRRGWLGDEEWRTTLDPIVSVYPDQLVFEAFSNDTSCYARLTAPVSAFDDATVSGTGTTNIDFSWDLRPLLQQLRSTTPTMLTIGAPTTPLPLGADPTARQVALPEAWLKSFLQVQGALTMRPFTFTVRPVDLLSIIAYLDEHFTRQSPQGMRYVFSPGGPLKVVLEPWEATFPLRGTFYTGYERVVRLWGRRRLALLRDVLPYADRVTVAVLGRGLPHLYICHCGPYRLMLALSGWAANDWEMGSGFDLLAAFQGATAERTARVGDFLQAHTAVRADEVAAATGIDAGEVDRALFQLSRAGRVLYDPLTNDYRARDLFGAPLDLERLFVSDPRLEEAQALIEGGKVVVRGVTSSGASTKVLALVHADIDYTVTVGIDENGRLRYGKCQCTFFRMNRMSRGPCEHILATRLAFDTPSPSDPVGATATDDDDWDEDDATNAAVDDDDEDDTDDASF